MAEQLLKHFSIEVEQILHEKKTSQGSLTVYQTAPFGMMLTLNDQVILTENDSFYYHEMMAHPALFTHPKPLKVAILGHQAGILQEILKHTGVQEIQCVHDNPDIDAAISRYFSSYSSKQVDARIKYFLMDTSTWLAQGSEHTFDIIIQADSSFLISEENFKNYFRLLTADGIFVQPCLNALLHFKTLKPLYLNIQQAGFNDWQLLNFPQPSYPTGFRTVVMATKQPAFKRIREKDIFNRPFTTSYYNFDVHQAALVLPEFMREALVLPSSQ